MINIGYQVLGKGSWMLAKFFVCYMERNKATELAVIVEASIWLCIE